MKKLSIILALILALSCFSFAAFAAPDMLSADEEASSKKAAEELSSVKEELSKLKEAPKEKVAVYVKVIYTAAHPDGKFHDSRSKEDWVASRIFSYSVDDGESITPDTILDWVKTTSLNHDAYNNDQAMDPVDGGKADANYRKPIMVLDGKEYTLNEKIFRGICVKADLTTPVDASSQTADIVPNPALPESIHTATIKKETPQYNGFIVYAAEIDDVENFAQVAASALGGYQWGGIAKANVTLINELIKGFNGAADSVAKDLPELSNKAAAANANNAVNGTTASSTSPATGASAIAGVAVVVLALASTTAVVLRKKED